MGRIKVTATKSDRSRVTTCPHRPPLSLAAQALRPPRFVDGRLELCSQPVWPPDVRRQATRRVAFRDRHRGRCQRTERHAVNSLQGKTRATPTRCAIGEYRSQRGERGGRKWRQLLTLDAQHLGAPRSVDGRGGAIDPRGIRRGPLTRRRCSPAKRLCPAA